MGIIRSLDTLDPIFRPLAFELVKNLSMANIHYRIEETLRTQETQEAYWLQSRAPLEEVNEARKKAGLYPLTESENKTTVTWARESAHLKGLAVDIVPVLVSKDGAYFVPWDYARYAEYWREIGAISMQLGLNWGGNWPPFNKAELGRDCPHHQTA
jgi:peptidoglycan L-alanyl-D-glutamate endopeptidase CwlK